MTRKSKKERERFFVNRAAELLGKNWVLGPDLEHTYFFLTEEVHQFGLEVREIFTGPQVRAGSKMKRKEAETQKVVDALRCQYEVIAEIPLNIRLLGDTSVENLAAVVPALVAKELSTRPVGYQEVIDLGNGLCVYVTRALHADWYSVNDRVGWVDRYPMKPVTDAIERKSKKLPRYREAAGPDIRLLLVADRICNSGKLMLDEGVALDVQGFQVVYFFSYPESVTVFDCTGNIA